MRPVRTVWLALALACAVPAAAQQQPKLRLNMASTFPGAMVLIGDAAKNKLPAKIARASGGEIDLRFNEPGALVPAAQAMDAVSQGSVDAAWAGAGWYSGKDTAFNMFSTVPFGPGIGEYMAWMYHGGGLQLSREMGSRCASSAWAPG